MRRKRPVNATQGDILIESIQLMLDKEFCDLTVVIETDIRCHRSILAKNGYLRAMLQSTSKETREDRVYLSNVKVEVF